MNVAQALVPGTCLYSYERAHTPEALPFRLRAPADPVTRDHRAPDSGPRWGGARLVRRPLRGGTLEVLAAIRGLGRPASLVEVAARLPHLRRSLLKMRLFSLCERGDVLRSGTRSRFTYRAAWTGRP